MKVDIALQFLMESSKIIEDFKNLGWQQEDLCYVTKEIPIDDEYSYFLSVTVYPELLSYSDKELSCGRVPDNNVIVPWMACRVYGFKRKKGEAGWAIPADKIMELMKAEIAKLPYKPFKDEDAPHQMFTRPEKSFDDFEDFKFYVNLSYPDGYWENHTLD